MKKRLCIILPAFNEAVVLDQVLKGLKKFLPEVKAVDCEVVVVDDGSRDKTAQIAYDNNVVVLRHLLNRGLGGALTTGLTYARTQHFDLALTMDSDGQHAFSDIPRMIKPLLAGKCDVVVGTRMKNSDGMPPDRKIINFVSNLVTFALFHIWTSDSQSGFRAFSREALRKINTVTQGMEVSSEFFAEIKKHNLRFEEVPIKVIYTDYSRTKGQSNLNSVFIGLKLFLRLFR